MALSVFHHQSVEKYFCRITFEITLHRVDLSLEYNVKLKHNWSEQLSSRWAGKTAVGFSKGCGDSDSSPPSSQAL